MRNTSLLVLIALAGCSGDAGSELGKSGDGDGTDSSPTAPDGTDSSPTAPDLIIDNFPPPRTARESRAARLTHAQLKHTVLDVLGVSVDDAILSQIPNDLARQNGFVTATESSPLSGDHVLGFGGLAKSVVAQVDPTASATALAQCAEAFEQFDVMGVHRAKDDMARDLFTAGYLQDADGGSLGEYAGVPDLMNLLFASAETSKCLVEQMLEFASVGGLDRADSAAVDAAHAVFKEEGGAFSHLVRSIAFAPSMRALKVAPPTP